MMPGLFHEKKDDLALPWLAPCVDEAEEDQPKDHWVRLEPSNDDVENSEDEEVEENAAESRPQVDRAQIVAYFGGMAFKLSDQQWLASEFPDRKRLWYGSSGDVGIQPQKNLVQAIKTGRVYK
eukprot:gene32448-31062_t